MAGRCIFSKAELALKVWFTDSFRKKFLLKLSNFLKAMFVFITGFTGLFKFESSYQPENRFNDLKQSSPHPFLPLMPFPMVRSVLLWVVALKATYQAFDFLLENNLLR